MPELCVAYGQEFRREHTQDDSEKHLCGFVRRFVGVGDTAQEEQEGHLFAEVRCVAVWAELSSALSGVDEDTEALWNGHEHSRVVLVGRLGSLLNASGDVLHCVGERRCEWPVGSECGGELVEVIGESLCCGSVRGFVELGLLQYRCDVP